MARPPDPSIRDSLRDRAVDYVLAEGITSLSLRPVAEALGTSGRMLIYHFGSREGLMKAILEGLREREDRQITAWFESERRPRSLIEFARWYWKRMSSPEARPAALLVFELYALALRSPEDYPGLLQEPVSYWESLAARAGLALEKNAATTTLLLAAMRGLLLDLTSTGDKRRVDRGMAKLLEMLERAG